MAKIDITMTYSDNQEEAWEMILPSVKELFDIPT
jgi:hypothetical protein